MIHYQIFGFIVLITIVSCYTIKIQVDKQVVHQGDSTMITISSIETPPPNLKYYAFVNHKQWGAPATPRHGIMVYNLIIPFPNVGIMDIQVTLQKPYNRSITPFPVGTSMISDYYAISNKVSVQVLARIIKNPYTPVNATRYIGMEWEPWFTPLNDRWDTGESVPIVGNYDSFNIDVITQHTIWMIEAGIDFIMVDWTNNLWEKNHWSERNPNVQELVNATTFTLDVYHNIRNNIQTPKVVLLLGLNNGVSSTMTAINEELEFIRTNYLAKYHSDTWVWYLGKPLIVILDTQGIHKTIPTPIDDRNFTVRWMSTQLQITHQEREGYWTWMDGSEYPIPTPIPNTNITEALTPATAYFDAMGWKGVNARGHCGGSTFIKQFKIALQTLPLFTNINQWNEFAGQLEGQGYGPDHDIYTDSYNVTHNNDMEPTDLNECAYRGCGGWGFQLLNIQRALSDMFRQVERGEKPSFCILTISSPERNATVSGNLTIEWNIIGKEPSAFAIQIDTHYQKVPAFERKFIFNISSFPKGDHIVRVTALGVDTPYQISEIQVDKQESTRFPVVATVPIHI
jgi:hypothetical protein